MKFKGPVNVREFLVFFIKSQVKLFVTSNCTTCAQVHELPLSHWRNYNNQDRTFFVYIYIIHIYIYIYIHIIYI